MLVIQLLAAPTWTPTTILQVDGDTRPELFLSPAGEAVLIQTLDQAGASSPGTSGRHSHLDCGGVDGGNITQWDAVDTMILDSE